MKAKRGIGALLGLMIVTATGPARAVDVPDNCPGVQLAFHMLPEAPGDVGVPLPEGAVFFGGNGGGEVRVNGEPYMQLPMARFLVTLKVDEAVAFYQDRLGDKWQRDAFLGTTVFFRRADLPEGGDVRDLLLSKPAAKPYVLFTDVEGEECAQALLKGARTMIEIAFEK